MIGCSNVFVSLVGFLSFICVLWRFCWLLVFRFLYFLLGFFGCFG